MGVNWHRGVSHSIGRVPSSVVISNEGAVLELVSKEKYICEVKAGLYSIQGFINEK